ncbi:MAG TPA: Uma2 family endonuclease, partial [Chloroflexota bacterium]|nr:Uma2 family endonuclease [Chloroflexota bacterium]
RAVHEPDWLSRIPNDSEEAPWMVMPDYQMRVINLLLSILSRYRTELGLHWYIGSELMVIAPRPGMTNMEVAPDLFIAAGDDSERDSWNVDVEGEGPRFVLEVVTRESWQRDTVEKVSLYDRLGVEEYAIFAPQRLGRSPQLSGYRRGAGDRWERWPLEGGALKSRVLGGLTIEVEDGKLLRLRDASGRLLLSHPEAVRLASQRADAEAERADAEAERAEAASRRAEAEAERAAAAERRAEEEAWARRQAEERLGIVEAELARLQARGSGQ